MKQHYKDLIVWQKAMGLVTTVYRVTKTFPKEEMYGLTSQIRRAAISVPSNIAEGQGRLTRGEFRQFLGQAKGSLLEMETQLLIAQNLGYLADPESPLDQLAEGSSAAKRSPSLPPEPATDYRQLTTSPVYQLSLL